MGQPITSAPAAELALCSRRIVLPDRVADGAVLIAQGRIIGLVPQEQAEAERVIDLGEWALLPGVVDTHAHLNEPGRTEWEGFVTGTAAAAAGGTTTVVDMPLNAIPPTTTVEALELKAAHAQGRCAVDHAFWGGLVPGNLAELEPMVRAGVCGFKAFLIDSGVEEFPKVERDELLAALPLLARLGVPLIAHAELDLGASGLDVSPKYTDYLRSRPPAWEQAAIRLLIELAEQTSARVHIVHLSSADALPEIAAARARGVRLTVETCPHYLTFAAEEIPDGATEFKCAPPIREAANRERLWRGLAEGQIDLVVSDHSPCTPALKRREEGDFSAAWGGIASLQLSLCATWTGLRERAARLGLTADAALVRLAQWTAGAPAALAGLDGAKGRIAVGSDADLVAFDPDARYILAPEMIHHRHKLTPYLGRTFHGRVEGTYLRGVPVGAGGAALGTSGGLRLRARSGR
jgi:allantoinase